MAFSLGDDNQEGISEINLIPLIDIMLVLMIIFLVTATVLNPAVVLDLPKTAASVNDLPEHVIQISIDKDGQLYWDDIKINSDELQHKLNQAAQQANKPFIHLRADKNSTYDPIAQVLALASQSGLDKIAFISE